MIMAQPKYALEYCSSFRLSCEYCKPYIDKVPEQKILRYFPLKGRKWLYRKTKKICVTCKQECKDRRVIDKWARHKYLKGYFSYVNKWQIEKGDSVNSKNLTI